MGARPLQFTQWTEYQTLRKNGILINTPTYTVKSKQGTRSGTSQRDYKTLIARLQNASTNYSVVDHQLVLPSRIRCTLSGHAAHPPNTVWTTDTVHTRNLTYPTGLVEDAVLTDQALKRIKGKLANDMKQFKSLVPIAEINETRKLASQVASATGQVLKSLIDLKHGNPRSAFKAASNAWLTFSFGVSPTINDLNSVLSSIDSYLNREDLVIRHSGRSESERQVTTVQATGGDLAGNSWVPTRVDTIRQASSFAVGLKVNMRSANNYGIAEHFGLQFGELPSTAWELVPFSWIVDYFTTTGDFLSDAFEAPSGSTFYATKAVAYEIETFISHEISLNSAYPYRSIQQNTPIQYKGYAYTRTSIGSLPHRSWRFKTADEIGVNSVKRLLNLASLLVK